MKNSVNKIVGITLYAVAGILLIYTVWAIIHSVGYIGDLIKSGQLAFAGNEYDIMSFYMANCAQYFVFAVLLAAVGFIIFRNKGTQSQPIESVSLVQANAEDEDNELDEWFEGMQSSKENNAE